MKVKPFYIRITKEITPQIVQSVFDKCVSAGAGKGDCVYGSDGHDEFMDSYRCDDFELFGVASSGCTMFYGVAEHFGFGAKEITLDQLDEWLGLDKTETPEEKEAFDSMANNSELANGSEWKSGDVCSYYCDEGNEWRDGVYVTLDNGFHVIRDLDDDGYTGVTKKHLCRPETPQQREEREREENAIAYFNFETQCFREAGESEHLLTDSWEQADAVAKEAYRIMAEKLEFKTNYRKAK